MKRLEKKTNKEKEHGRLLHLCQEINWQASHSAWQLNRNLGATAPHATHTYTVHAQTCHVSPDDYHYRGKCIWPWKPDTLTISLCGDVIFFSS